MKTHLGSCHCGTVRFEIRTSEPLDPYFRCNCSLCARKGAVMGEGVDVFAVGPVHLGGGKSLSLVGPAAPPR